MHSIRLGAMALALIVMPAAMAAPIGGKHGRSEIKGTCGANGGSYFSNLDGYGCVKENCDGKGGVCGVTCTNGGDCQGQTPPSRAVGVRKGKAGSVSGVLKFRAD
ncbi:MAG: hypothetical protein WAT78_01335 [Rhizobiaceae bacterium]